MGFFNTAIEGAKTLLGWGDKQTKAMATQAVRRAEGNTALQFVEGNAPKQLTVKSGQPDDNVFVNYPAVIVEKGVSFLFGDSFRIEPGTEQGAADYLERVWPEDQRAEDFLDMGTDGGVFGHAWLKINIEEDGTPCVTVGDPQNWMADTAPDNYRKVSCYRCQYERLNESGKKILYKEEASRDGRRWVIREFESTNGGKSWLQIGEDKFWNYEFPPVYHCKNLPKSKSFYGRSDLPKYVLELAKYISRLDSLLGKITRVHSAPKPYAKGMTAQDLKMDTDGMLFLPKVDMEVGLLEITGDLAGALVFRKLLREALAEISHVPEVATGKMENVGQLSSLALKILYGPLVERTNTKRRLYGRPIKDIVYALCIIGNVQVKRGDIKLNWPDPIPTDPKVEAETSVIRTTVGFSKDTEIQRLGGDPEAEKKKREAEVSDYGTELMKGFDAGRGADINKTPGAPAQA